MTFSCLPFLSAGVAAVDPTLYANLSAWWDAANLAYSDATPIDNASAKFTDRSANANHLVQGTTANQPKLKTSIINGKNIVRFDGSASPNNDKLAFTASMGLTGDWTVIVVGLVTADSIIFGNTTTTLQLRRYWLSIENLYSHDSNNGAQSDALSTAHGSVHMMVWRRTGTSIKYRENKTDRTGASYSSAITWTLSVLGTRNDNAAPLKGDIGEAIIYAAYRSDAECDNLYDAYLKPKWGLP